MSIIIPVVTTQFELNDKDLKIASIQSDTVDGEAVLLLKVPGIMANGDGRFVSGGYAWFDSQHKDDRILNIEVVDIDNVLGYGENVVVKTYHDDDVDDANKGWRIPIKFGHLEVETLGGYGFIPAELYLRVVGRKGDSSSGTLYINVEWGKKG